MLTEHFVAATGTPNKAPNTSIAKDAAIFVYESQPLSAQRAVFKKSATPPNCLAVSASHVFAAQVDKAVVHVYAREKGNQEATIAFPERIGCLTLACKETVVVLGTDKGRLFLWETHTGRQIATSQAHLQSVTALAADPTSTFLLSGSADSSIHVWSLPALLSFSGPDSAAPLHTLSAHRDAITALVSGHSGSSCNIAVSASRDNTCVVWDYHSSRLLRTVLLPSTPLCLSLDPADRAFYTGYEDGSVHILEFSSPAFSATDTIALQHTLYNETYAAMPVQPAASARWEPPTGDNVGAALSVTVSYDGTTLTTGHASGKIINWDIPTGRYSKTLTNPALPGPVTNLYALPVTGFVNSPSPKLKLHAIVKPRYGAFDNSSSGDGLIPANYTISAQLVGNLPNRSFSAADAVPHAAPSAFDMALTHPSFPPELLAATFAELTSWRQPAAAAAAGPVAREAEDFMSLDAPDATSAAEQLQQANARMQQELAALRRVQKTTFAQMEGLRGDKAELLARLQERQGREQDVRTEREAREMQEAERGWSELGARAGEKRRKQLK